MASARTVVEGILAKADVRINGDRLGDLQIHNEKFFERLFRQGTLGLGESYMDSWWDASSIDEFVCKALGAHLLEEAPVTPTLLFFVFRGQLFNLQSKARAHQIGEAHYDLGNDLYKAMLDKSMTYTCGYWSSPTHPAQNLDEAEEAKLDLVCKKIGLKKGDRVLDIGCGWGSFAKHAAEKYGASVVGITVSREQAELGRKLCAGLPVEIRVQDYRDVNETFDHIISLGMFEHVGAKNYRTYMEVARRCLKDDGLFLLHTIGRGPYSPATDPWIEKYIFPNGMVPSSLQIEKAIEKKFVMEDWHNFGADYDKTLMAWFTNFDRAWPTLQKTYGDRFYRMWKYYLLACAGAFRARDLQLWQIVLSKNGVSGGYKSVR